MCSWDNFKKVFKDEKDNSYVIPDEVIKELNEEFEFAYRNFKDKPREEIIKEMYDAYIKANKHSKDLSIQTLIAKLRLEGRIAEAVSKGISPHEVIQSAISGSRYNFTGAGESAEAYAKSFHGQLINELAHIIERDKLGEYTKAKYDKQIAMAHAELSKGAKIADVTAKYGDGITKTASMYRKLYQNIYDTLQNNGVDVGYLEGYLGRRTYSIEEIKKSAESREDFKRMMAEKVDWEATLGDRYTKAENPSEVIRAYLNTMVASMENRGISSTISRYKKQRKIAYKSPDGWIDVMQKYGYHDNLFHNLLGSMRDASNKIGAFKTLGAAPDEMLNFLMNKYLVSKTHREGIEARWKLFKGMPRSETALGHAVDILTTSTSIALLPKAGITAITTDPIDTINTLYETGILPSRTQAALNVFGKYMLSFKKEYRSEVARNVGLMLDNIEYNVGRLLEREGGSGWFDKLHALSYRWGGLEQTTNAIKSAVALTGVDNFFLSWKRGANINLKEYTRRLGFRDHEIAMIMKYELDDGHYRVESFDKMSLDGINIPKGWGEERVKAEFKNKIALLANDLASKAAPTAGINERAMLGKHLGKDTPIGAFVTLSSQFMSTPLNGFYNMLQLHHLSGNRGTLSRAMLMGTRLAGVILTATLTQYIRDALKKETWTDDYDARPWFIKGWEEENLVPQIASIVQKSNILGILGDATLSSIAYEHVGPMEAFIGPAPSIINVAVKKIFSKIRNKNAKLTDADINFIIRSTPVLSHPLPALTTKFAIDALKD